MSAVGMSGVGMSRGGGFVQGVGMSGRWIPTAPPNMGPEGGIPLGRGTWDTTGFSRQAGGTYPTGMFFFAIVLLALRI